MTTTIPAATKLPTYGPGTFRYITNALTGEGGNDAPRRFRAVASSTITDLAGNTISLNALQQLRDDFRAGLPIFMDHDHENVVDKVFGQSDTADIVETDARDERTGAPIYDLVIAGKVNEPNPRAVQLHDSIAGGYVKFGASIGAIVREHKRDKETGGMLINGIVGKEASIVGIAKNQRSFAYYASLGAADQSDDILDDEEQVVATSGEVLQQWVAKPTFTSSLDTTTTTTVVTLGDTAEPETAPGAPQATETAATLDTTPGGQEADAATPETAPATEDEAVPAIEQQADIVPVEDVEALVAHVKGLVSEIGHLRTENERLAAELVTVKASHDRLSTVEADATRAINQVMSLPLRRQAVGHVNDFTAAYPGLDPRVSAYIARATKDKE